MCAYLVRYRLPVSYSTEIGRIITRWAYLEWRLRETAYLLLELDAKQGRIAVREPRATDYLTMIGDLMRIKSLQISKVDLRQLQKALKPLRHYRDALAHGVWLKHEWTNIPVLQVVAGSYPPAPGKKTIKARIDPQGIEVTLKNLKEIVAGIEAATGVVNVLKSEIEAQLSPFRGKSRTPESPGH